MAGSLICVSTACPSAKKRFQIQVLILEGRRQILTFLSHTLCIGGLLNLQTELNLCRWKYWLPLCFQRDTNKIRAFYTALNLGPFSPNVLKALPHVVLKSFVYLEIFESNKTSNLLNHTV